MSIFLKFKKQFNNHASLEKNKIHTEITLLLEIFKTKVLNY